MSLQVEGRPVGEVYVTKCAGRLVAGEVHTLQAFVHKALRDHQDVVLQMEHVNFVDSSGLGALVRLVQSAKSEGRHLRLCAVPDRVRQAIELTNLQSLFEMHLDESDAIVAAYLGGRGQAADGNATVLCAIDSADLRTFLGEVLCHAGYRALTVANLNDARILMKATKARVVVLGPKNQSLHGVPAKNVFDEIDPGAELILLDADFAGLEPGEAAAKVLGLVRAST